MSGDLEKSEITLDSPDGTSKRSPLMLGIGGGGERLLEGV